MTKFRKGNLDYRYRGMLAPPRGHDTMVTASVGPDNDLVALWTTSEQESDTLLVRTMDNGVTFGASRTDTNPTVAFARYTAGSLTPTHVVETHLPVAHAHIQPTDDGGFLAVGARCRWTPDGGEKNAIRIDSNGCVLAEGVVGDGIAHVLVDDKGKIWVGYYDEGVFGNAGWGGPDRGPIGSSGLVRFSEDFDVAWRYRSPDDLAIVTRRGHTRDQYHIADCYALNVPSTGDALTVLACTYSDFPLIAVNDADGSLVTQVRPTVGLYGPRGVVANGDTVVFLGAYREPGAIFVCPESDLSRIEKSQSTLPVSAGRRNRLVCRGRTAHFFAGNDWYTIDVPD